MIATPSALGQSLDCSRGIAKSIDEAKLPIGIRQLAVGSWQLRLKQPELPPRVEAEKEAA